MTRTHAIRAALMACVLWTGCAPVRMRWEPELASCRQAATPDGPPVRWLAPSDAGHRRRLRSWCDAVGPVVAHAAAVPAASADRPLVFVSWNMAVGRGDLPGLVREVRSEHPGAQLVLLLQEAYRAGPVPDECPEGSRRARALGLPRSPGSEDITDLARRLDMHAVYAPSMRNGVDCAAEPREDRGNAILSTVALSEITVIELPFARQRRLALAARVRHGARPLLVVSTHFDTLRGHQGMARAIAQAVRLLAWTGPVVIGGDFNSALMLDRGMREMRKHFAELDCGSGATHAWGRLDHVFVGGLDRPVPCRTGEQRHGSDHRPLIAVLPAPGAPEGR
jgi:endonuclease/exonuclease/phosphatase family metal-dependent hydrolase